MVLYYYQMLFGNTDTKIYSLWYDDIRVGDIDFQIFDFQNFKI